jgi:phage tail-like protein
MPVKQFVTIDRIDPYKNFKFRVLFDGAVVAGVSKVSALKRSTEVVSHREGNDISTPRLSPAASKFEPITLERGMTFATEFQEWAQLVYGNNSAGDDAAVSLLRFRKRLTIEMLNLQGTTVRSYEVVRCWVSEYTALPELDANGNAIAFESIVIQNEGFSRIDVAEVEEF